MTGFVDLHTHSTASDGIYAPATLVQLASEAGLRVMALTDHDSTNGIGEATRAAKTLDIELIPGIELNTDGSGSEVHMLGYFPQYEQPAFQESLRILRGARVRRAERMVERLNELGFHITWERVRQLAHGAVGRPHIAEALVEAGYTQSVQEAFEKYICTGCPAYIPRYKLTIEDAIHLITSVNGLPVIAHPADLLKTGKLRDWLPHLCEVGLIGLETYYGRYEEAVVDELHKLANEYGLVPTGGSDFHGPAIHPTPLGERFVPYESVERLKAAALERKGKTPAAFQLRPAAEEW